MGKKVPILIIFALLLLPGVAAAQAQVQDWWSWGQRTDQQTKTDWWTMQYDRRDQNGQNPLERELPMNRPFTGHDNGYRNGTTWNGTTGMQYPYGLREQRPLNWGTQPRRR